MAGPQDPRPHLIQGFRIPLNFRPARQIDCLGAAQLLATSLELELFKRESLARLGAFPQLMISTGKTPRRRLSATGTSLQESKTLSFTRGLRPRKRSRMVRPGQITTTRSTFFASPRGLARCSRPRFAAYQAIRARHDDCLARSSRHPEGNARQSSGCSLRQSPGASSPSSDCLRQPPSGRRPSRSPPSAQRTGCESALLLVDGTSTPRVLGWPWSFPSTHPSRHPRTSRRNRSMSPVVTTPSWKSKPSLCWNGHRNLCRKRFLGGATSGYDLVLDLVVDSKPVALAARCMGSSE